MDHWKLKLMQVYREEIMYRVVFFYVLVLLLGVILSSISKNIGLDPIVVFLSWILFALTWCYINGINFEQVGLKCDFRSVVYFIIGLVFGLLSLSSIVCIILLANFGYIQATYAFIDGLYVSYLILFTLIQALAEELVFRSYPLSELSYVDKNKGLLATAIIFGCLHIFNANFTIFAFLTLFLAGIFLGKLFLRIRDTWIITGFHAGWNIAEGFIFGVPISGISPTKSIFILKMMGPEILTGGKFGLEGSIIATFIFLLLIIILTWDWNKN